MSFHKLDDCIQKLQDFNSQIQDGIEISYKVAYDCEENESGTEIVDKLHEVMIQYAKLKRDLKQCCEAANDSKNQFQSVLSRNNGSQEIGNFCEVYNKNLEALQSRNTDVELNEFTHVVDFKNTVWNQHHKLYEPSNVDNDCELEVTQDKTNQYICPITKTEFVDPMINTECGHSYSKEAILSHIQLSKRKCRCPVGGCIQLVRLESLKPNNVISFQMKNLCKTYWQFYLLKLYFFIAFFTLLFNILQKF
ncbi:E3 SUMO-protein ligase NSE2 [Hydra vulgaris]|uniref:E3 SUMO-protein ligase NSE2 n=1 Tax=Hydra vulgaris TaxID=6087 RepID=UPI001F5E50EA|nr:E3 SUMO-protein ligase NSE2 [Hydra vulgaris]